MIIVMVMVGLRFRLNIERRVRARIDAEVRELGQGAEPMLRKITVSAESIHVWVTVLLSLQGPKRWNGHRPADTFATRTPHKQQ